MGLDLFAALSSLRCIVCRRWGLAGLDAPIGEILLATAFQRIDPCLSDCRPDAWRKKDLSGGGRVLVFGTCQRLPDDMHIQRALAVAGFAKQLPGDTCANLLRDAFQRVPRRHIFRFNVDGTVGQ